MGCVIQSCSGIGMKSFSDLWQIYTKNSLQSSIHFRQEENDIKQLVIKGARNTLFINLKHILLALEFMRNSTFTYYTGGTYKALEV